MRARCCEQADWDTRSAQRSLAFAEAEGWKIEMVLETHAHADHLSAAPLIKAQTGAWIGIGAPIRDVQKIFRPVFAMDDLSVPSINSQIEYREW